MTNSDLTLLAVLVDRSGSMASCQSDMEGELNTFLESQGQQPGLLDGPGKVIVCTVTDGASAPPPQPHCKPYGSDFYPPSA